MTRPAVAAALTLPALLTLAASAAAANEAPAMDRMPAREAAEQRAWDIGAEASIVTDYRDRGLSFSDLGPAAQAFAALTSPDGFYAAVWGSTLAASRGGTGAEIGVGAGAAHALPLGVAADVSLWRYFYTAENGWDVFEGYLDLSRRFGPVTARIGAAWMPKQASTVGPDGRRQGNLYLHVRAEAAVVADALLAEARLGRERGAFAVRGDGKWDWRLGLIWRVRPKLSVTAAYVDSDARSIAERGRDLTGAGIIAGARAEF